MTKPPTQIAGVVGISATPITMNEAFPWTLIAGLPPFQMFAAERMRNTSGKDSMGRALEYVRALGGGSDVLQAYEEWHAAKGYWPNEDPFGRVRGE